jgi:hypothetical protein
MLSTIRRKPNKPPLSERYFDERSIFERITARGPYESFIQHYLCHYAVFDNLLKIRSLRATGEIELKATLPNFGNGVTNYVYLNCAL